MSTFFLIDWDNSHVCDTVVDKIYNFSYLISLVWGVGGILHPLQ